MLIMIAGLALFASILSSIADIVANGSRRAKHEAAVRGKLTDVQQWMADLTLTSHTRQAVLRFYSEDWAAARDEQREILSELPSDVAAAAIWDLVRWDFKQLPLFMSLSPPETLGLEDPELPDETAKVCCQRMHARAAAVCARSRVAHLKCRPHH
jgi:hypothetical protein